MWDGIMCYHGIELGSASLVHRFLSEVGASGQRIQSLFLVSPFVELSSQTELSQRILRTLLEAKSQGADVALVSDNTSGRRSDFGITLSLEPELEETLFLHPKLHAKAGIATLRSGYQFGFVGSANLTPEGLARNRELVVGLGNDFSGSEGSMACAELDRWMHDIVAQSVFAQPILNLIH